MGWGLESRITMKVASVGYAIPRRVLACVREHKEVLRFGAQEGLEGMAGEPGARDTEGGVGEWT